MKLCLFKICKPKTKGKPATTETLTPCERDGHNYITVDYEESWNCSRRVNSYCTKCGQAKIINIG